MLETGQASSDERINFAIHKPNKPLNVLPTLLPLPTYHSGTNNLLFQILHNTKTLLLISQPSTPTNLTILPSLCDLALLNARLEGTTAHIQFLGGARGRDVEVEDVHWEAKGCACARK